MKRQLPPIVLTALALLANCATAGATVYTRTPAADTYVAQSGPNVNHGAETELRVRSSASGNGSQTLVRFTVPALDGGVVSTKLRLRVGAKTIPQVTLYRFFMGNPQWSETALTWNNWQTGTTSFQLEQRLSLAANTWVEFDVTGNLPASGSVTFGLTSTSDTSSLLFTSKETATAPQLVIVTAAGCASQIQCGPDTYTAGVYPAGFTPDPSCTPPCVLPAFAWDQHFIEMERLGNHTAGSGDSFTERFSFAAGLEGLGSATPATPFLESWYVPARPLGSTTGALNRLYSTQYQDYMDSRAASEGGYAGDQTLGYPWLTQQPGTTKVQRYVRTTPRYDHQTWFTVPPGFSTDSTWTDRWGFPRFGNRLEACDVERSPFYTEKSTGVLDVRFYKAWGDAIGYLAFHKPDGALEQLTINTPPFMIQALIFAGSYLDPVTNQQTPIPCPACRPGNICYNPAQAGAADQWYVGNTARWMGSPVISTTETTGRIYDRVSEVKPFNITGASWLGTSSLKPLLWRGAFRVQTSLGAVVGGTPYGDVLRLRFNARADTDALEIPKMPSNLNVFMPFLLPNSGGPLSLMRVARMDVQSGGTTLLAPSWNEQVWVCSPPGKGGPVTCPQQAMIVERSDGIAFGLYAPTKPQYYNLLFTCNDGDASVHSSCGTSYNAVFFNTFDYNNLTTSYAAAKEQDTFLVIGSFDNVRQRLLDLGAAYP